MATDTFQIVATDATTTPATVITSTASITSTGMSELLGWCIAMQFPLGVLVSGQVGGTGANAPVYRAATAQDALNYMANSILTAYEAETRSWLQQQAAAAAAADVAPVQ